MRGVGPPRRLCLGFLATIAAVRLAVATPTFRVQISTAGATHLAVGASVPLRAYPPRVYHGRRDVTPIAAPLRWTATPPDVATVSDDGRITAVRPGTVQVRVGFVHEADGARFEAAVPVSIRVVAALEGGRLPLFDPSPVGLERLDLAFETEPNRRRTPDGRRTIAVALETQTWTLHLTVACPADGARLPWTLESVPAHALFDDDTGFTDLRSPDDHERWRKNVRAARLTLSRWEDGVATGRLEVTTTRRTVSSAPGRWPRCTRRRCAASAAWPPAPTRCAP